MTFAGLLKEITHDYPWLTFKIGKNFHWSPRTQTVEYKEASSTARSDTDSWTLLHELGHATLEHHTYRTDFQLLKLEAAAWQQAAELGRSYGIVINDDYAQDCLDTYRDWLHTRSTCPTCHAHGVQINETLYRCLNCRSGWRVSASRFCRPHRRIVRQISK